MTFEEDFREKFEGHAYLHVTWGIPEGVCTWVHGCITYELCEVSMYVLYGLYTSTDRNGLEYYNVEWDSLPDVGDKEARKFCAKEGGLPVTYYLDTVCLPTSLTNLAYSSLTVCPQTSTNLTISAKDGNATTPPQYGCVYSVTVCNTNNLQVVLLSLLARLYFVTQACLLVSLSLPSFTGGLTTRRDKRVHSVQSPMYVTFERIRDHLCT